MKRNRRAGVEDRWHKTDGQRAARYGTGMRWRARYVDDDGREHTKAFGRKADAQQWLDGIISAQVTGTYVTPEAGKTTVALQDNRIPRSLCHGVQLPERQHADRGYLTHGQLAALSAKIDYLPEVVRFLAYTGLQWGETAALRVADFDMLRRRVNVSRSVSEFNGLQWSTPKSHERRSVPFPTALVDELAALMVGKRREDLVFTTHRGGVLRSSNYRSRFFSPAVEVCRETDERFPTITPHDLRHTAASLTVSAGANAKAVQRIWTTWRTVWTPRSDLLRTDCGPSRGH